MIQIINENDNRKKRKKIPVNGINTIICAEPDFKEKNDVPDEVSGVSDIDLSGTPLGLGEVVHEEVPSDGAKFEAISGDDIYVAELTEPVKIAVDHLRNDLGHTNFTNDDVCEEVENEVLNNPGTYPMSYQMLLGGPSEVGLVYNIIDVILDRLGEFKECVSTVESSGQVPESGDFDEYITESIEDNTYVPGDAPEMIGDNDDIEVPEYAEPEQPHPISNTGLDVDLSLSLSPENEGSDEVVRQDTLGTDEFIEKATGWIEDDQATVNQIEDEVAKDISELTEGCHDRESIDADDNITNRTLTESRDDAGFWKVFEEMVPDSGSRGDIASEIIRAVGKIAYRFYNDGDYLGAGYGNETTNYAGRYLMNNASTEIRDIIVNMWSDNPAEPTITSSAYENLLNRLMRVAVSYVQSNPQLAEESSDDMLDYFDDDIDTHYDDIYDDDSEDEYYGEDEEW